MSTTSKGNRIEHELEVWLQEQGYLVHRAVRKAVWIGKGRVISKPVDIFGLFDLVAKHPKFPDYTFYFQISTEWKSGADRAALELFPQGKFDRVFMVRRQDRQSREYKYFHGGRMCWEDFPEVIFNRSHVWGSCGGET